MEPSSYGWYTYECALRRKAKEKEHMEYHEKTYGKHLEEWDVIL